MSQIFDALQRHRGERADSEPSPLLGPEELLELVERETAAEKECDVQEEVFRLAGVMTDSRSTLQEVHPLHLDFMAGTANATSATAQADALQVDQEKKPQGSELQMDDKQRDELLKFVQQLILVPGAPRTIVLFGTEAGNGCTWVCSRAAQILASQVKGAVCLVDGNLRSPGLHKVFGTDHQDGLTDALNETKSVRTFVRPVAKHNLWLLSCGSDLQRRDALLNSDRLKQIISELRRYFDYVVIDSPGLNIGRDAIVLAQAADAAVLVVKANSSRRDTARRGVQELQHAGVRVLGAVLNQRSFPIPQSIYSKL
jgi:protein-tyrosine kinase